MAVGEFVFVVELEPQLANSRPEQVESCARPNVAARYGGAEQFQAQGAFSKTSSAQSFGLGEKSLRIALAKSQQHVNRFDVIKWQKLRNNNRCSTCGPL